jgi:glycosyltransferase involved in cell wall biosynthesis
VINSSQERAELSFWKHLRRDGVPAVLMGAMAMAKPCVSTMVSGIPELIKDGHSGLLVPEKDEVALADALRCLLDAPQLASRLGQAGRKKVCRAFNLDHVADQLFGLFASELTGRVDPEMQLSTAPLIHAEGEIVEVR